MSEKMPAGKFKAECLKVMDRVSRTRRKIIITKRNIPIAEIGPIRDSEPEEAFGKLSGTVQFHCDIVKPIDEEWDANS